ncbi:MAG: ATP-binding cassette domain-containing protein [Tissierellia bacterium]|nr:ATP-binding cassette domain-containing protein [Tissierellia bacterium]
MSLVLDVNKDFSDFKVNIKLDVGNEIIGFLGNSGSGKSVTLKMIAGIIKPDKGLIKIDDDVVFSEKNKINISTRERKVGYLFQDYAIFPHLSVKENIRIVLDKKRKDHYTYYLKKFNILELENKKSYQLSGGQKQRLALARMLATNPKIVLLDEPFSALDTDLRWRIERSVYDFLKNYNKTSILVSHNKDEIYRICQKVAIIKKGEIIEFSDKKSIFENPNSIHTAKLIGIKNTATILNKGEYIVANEFNQRFNFKTNSNFLAFKPDIFSFAPKDKYIDIFITDLIENPGFLTIISKNKNSSDFMTFDFKYSDICELKKGDKKRLYYNINDIMLFDY